MSGWPKVKLGDIFEITSSKRVFQKDWKSEGIPFYRAREIVELSRNGFVDNKLFISNEMYEGYTSKYGIPKEGDIMVTGVGTLGICYVVKKNDKFYFKDGNIIWFKKKSKVNSYYIDYIFKTNTVRKQIDNSSGSTVGTFTISKAKNTVVPLPPIEEQRRIVAILDKAVEVERASERVSETQDEIIRSTFLDMFGDPVTNPKGWGITQIKEISEVQGGLQVSHKRLVLPIKVSYLRVANVYRNQLNLDDIKSMQVTSSELERTKVAVGDILVVEGHGNKMEIGRCAVWDGSIDCCVHQNHLIRIRPNKALIIPQFLAEYINSEGGRIQMFKSSNTTSGLNTISTRIVKEISCYLPPLTLQRQFLNIINAIDSLDLGALEAHATTLKDSLTQELLA